MKTLGITSLVGPALVLGVMLSLVGCGAQTPPVVPESSPPPPPSTQDVARSPAPVTPPPPPSSAPEPPPIVPRALSPDEEFARRSLEELNRESPLEPVYFPLDSSELNDRARRIVEGNAEVLRRFPSWVVTVEGHCDERGTAEYNLALGERRALVARRYLVELGIGEDRVRTVSYGKEFPFNPGHDEGAWSENRRAHFVITAK